MTTDGDQTLGGPDALPPAGQPRVPVLWVAHAPAQALVGARLGLRPHVDLEVGRASDVLGPGWLDDPRISKRHAVIQVLDDHLVVDDLGSTNGTWVDGVRVTRARVDPGHVLRFGDTRLLVTLGPASRAPLAHPRLHGVSDALSDVLDEVALAAPRDVVVLVVGEPGVGKELVAMELHLQSGRGGAWVAVNCGGLPPEMVQSELFGHREGAFTGAVRERAGLGVAAAGGTLFLDEIGTASEALQTSLLRLLENRELRPLGADEVVRLEARVIAATNEDLRAAARAGRLRHDLVSRLERWLIRVPPLRERPEDVPVLAAHFAREHCGPGVRLDGALVDRLLLHDWREGNVRELQAIMERLCAAPAPLLGVPTWLDERLGRGRLPDPPRAAAALQGHRALDDPDALLRLFHDHRGNVSAMARARGVTRNTMYRRLRAAGILPKA